MNRSIEDNNTDQLDAGPSPAEPLDIQKLGLIATELQSHAAYLEQLCTYMHKAADSALKTAWDMGGLLLDAKRLCKHGEWKPWLEQHVPQISYSTALRYMKLRSKYATVALLPQDEGLTDCFRLAGVNLGRTDIEKRDAVEKSAPDALWQRKLGQALKRLSNCLPAECDQVHQISDEARFEVVENVKELRSRLDRFLAQLDQDVPEINHG